MRTIRTPEKSTAFLAALIEAGGNATEACRAAGLSRTAVHEWRKDDPDFAAAFKDALELGTDALEDEATRRAHRGTPEPVFYQGKECGTVRKYSDTLLIFLLKARRPERFKERAEFTGPGGGPVIVQVVTYAAPSPE